MSKLIKKNELNRLYEGLLINQSTSLQGQLLIEDVKPSGVKLIKEEMGNTIKYYIEGIFSEFDTKNQNGRVYPRSVMEPEIIRYYEKFVKTGRALGEINHPDSSTINLDNVSHRIVNLWIEGNNVYGKAIIGGPKGDAIIKLLEMGAVLGVSSRSLGNMDNYNNVTELDIRTWDIVHEPSVSSAIMTSLQEAVQAPSTFDWMCDNSGFVTPQINEDLQNINKTMLLNNEERERYAEIQVKRFIDSLYQK